MTTLYEILRQVSDIVQRRELSAYTKGRVVMALRHVHNLADFENDRVETIIANVSITFSSTANNVGTFAQPSFVRKYEVIRPLDISNNNIGNVLENITVKELTKREVLSTTLDTYYVQGGNISFISSVDPYNMNLSYFKLPDTSGDWNDYSDWATDKYEAAIIDLAVGFIELIKGNKEVGQGLLEAFNTIHKQDILDSESVFSLT